MNDVKLPPLRRRVVREIINAAVAGDTRTLRALVRWYATQAVDVARQAQEKGEPNE